MPYYRTRQISGFVNVSTLGSISVFSTTQQKVLRFLLNNSIDCEVSYLGCLAGKGQAVFGTKIFQKPNRCCESTKSTYK